MKREEKIDLLNKLLEIEEKNDIGNLTRAERGEFQQWINDDIEQEPCDKCVYSTKDSCCQYDDITETIPPFEPCEDTISRQAVQDYIAKYLSQYLYEDVRQAVETIDTYIGDMPSVNPQEPKTGHWIEHPEIKTSTPEYLMFYECSECGDKQCFCKSDIHKKHFCSNCGAKMEEEEL